MLLTFIITKIVMKKLHEIDNEIAQLTNAQLQETDVFLRRIR